MVFFLFIQRYYILSSRNSKLIVFILRGFKIVFQSYLGVILFIFVSHLIQFITNFFIIGFLTNFNFKVTTRVLTFFQIWSTLLEYLFYLILLIFMLIDFILNFRLHEFKTYLIRNDPFFFRIQSFFVIPLIICQLVYDFLGSGFWVYNAECFDEERWLSVLKSIVYFIEKILYMLYFSGIVILISYLQKMKSCYVGKKKDFVDQLDEIFSNPKLTELFIKFAQNEYSMENVLLYNEIQKFKKMAEKERIKNSSRIYLKYLNGEYSELEVNVPRRWSNRVKIKLDSNEIPNIDLFDDVLTITRENLSDTYSRFILSNEMTSFLETQKLLMENTHLLNKNE